MQRRAKNTSHVRGCNRSIIIRHVRAAWSDKHINIVGPMFVAASHRLYYMLLDKRPPIFNSDNYRIYRHTHAAREQHAHDHHNNVGIIGTPETARITHASRARELRVCVCVRVFAFVRSFRYCIIQLARCAHARGRVLFQLHLAYRACSARAIACGRSCYSPLIARAFYVVHSHTHGHGYVHANIQIVSYIMYMLWIFLFY